MNAYRTHYETQAQAMIQGHVLDHFFRFQLPLQALCALNWQLGHPLRVLDVGCGDGDIAQRLAKRPEMERLIVVDLAESCVSKVRGWYGLAGAVAWAEALPFADKRFDVALLVAVLEHVIDPRLVIEEAERVADYVVAVVPSVPDQDPDHVRLADLKALVEVRDGAYACDGKEEGAVWRSRGWSRKARGFA